VAALTPETDLRSTRNARAGGHGRTRRRVALLVAIVVLGWSIVELANLVFTHTTGAELYGVLVAVLAVTAAAITLALLRSGEPRFWLTVAVLVVWTAIAIGGLAGVAAHIVGPVAGHGPVDARPRPIAAPLIFTLLGVVDGAALFFGQRLGSDAVPWPWKE
jgi:hypothetical protein